VEIPARRVDAERPARGAELLPGRQPERMAQNVARDELRIADCGLRRIDKEPERVGLRRPIEIAERPGEAVEMVLGAVVIPVDRVEPAHEASAALVSFIRRSISSIACAICARRRSWVVAAS